MKKNIILFGLILFISLVLFVEHEAKADIFGSTLVTWWTLDSNKVSGATITDVSSTDTGTITGSAPLATGNIGQSISFDGATTSVRGANTINSSAATVSVWVNIASYPVGGGMMPLGFRPGNLATSYDKDIVVDAAGKVFFYYFSGAVKCTTLSTNAVPLNTWHMLTGVINSAGAGGIMYVDGKSVGTNVTNGSVSNYVAADVMMGGVSAANGAGATCGGGFAAESRNITANTKISDARIYNVALAAKDVAALYQLGLGHHHGAF